MSDDLARRWREAKLGARDGSRVLVSVECEGDPRAEVLAAIDRRGQGWPVGKFYTMEDGGAVFTDLYNGLAVRTDRALFGIAQRDGGIEVMRDGVLAWSSEHPDAWRTTVGIEGPPEAFGLPGGDATGDTVTVSAIDREHGEIMLTGTVDPEHVPVAPRRPRKRGGKS